MTSCPPIPLPVGEPTLPLLNVHLNALLVLFSAHVHGAVSGELLRYHYDSVVEYGTGYAPSTHNNSAGKRYRV